MSNHELVSGNFPGDISTVFPEVEHPEEGYKVGDKVIHRANALSYRIRRITPDGRYLLGHDLTPEETKRGRMERFILADKDDFRGFEVAISAHVSIISGARQIEQRKKGITEIRALMEFPTEIGIPLVERSLDRLTDV